MLSFKRWIPGRVLGLLVAVGLTVSLGACGDILGSEDPDVVTPGTAQGPAAIPVVKNGIIGNFQDMYSEYALYTGMLTDEYILAGTFPTRQQVDQRRMGADNATLNGDMWEPIQSVLQQAKDANETWTSNLGNATWQNAGVVSALPVARFYAGYTTLLQAEAYCQTVLNPRGAPIAPAAAADSAIALLQAAETAANNAGNSMIAMASIVGQARAEAFKGNVQAAATLTSSAGIPSDFVYVAEYSGNSFSQENEIHQFTHGQSQALRWTVGDGSLANRGNEIYEFYSEWAGLELILPPSDPRNTKTAFDSSIPVHLQVAHDTKSTSIPLATGWEARALEIEAELRTGAAAAAQTAATNLINNDAVNPQVVAAMYNNTNFGPGAFPPSLPGGGDFNAVTFSTGGDPLPEADARELSRLRAAGLWQTGSRLGYWRRILNNDGTDLFHSRTGTDTCFPITQQEIDDNPNL